MPKAASKKLRKSEPTEAEWWRAEELGREPHEILDTLVRQIEDDQESRYEAYREYARMFGVDPDFFGEDHRFLFSEVVSQNELANTIETLHAQLFKNNVIPAISTSEVDYEEWSRGRGASRWLEGLFEDSEVAYDALPRSGIDMLVYGTGFIKIDHEEDEDGSVRILFHRVDPRMVAVDRLEARQGKPRNFYQKDYVDMYQLAEEYSVQEKGMYGTPEERCEGILCCKPNDDVDLALGNRVKTTMLTVREAWHLPTKPGRKDGRHVIWVKGCTLVDEPWAWNRFPFTKMYFGQPLGGYYGESAVKKLAPTQRQHDKLNTKIDQAQDIMGVPRIILQRGAHLVRTHLDDIPGGVLEVDIPNAIQEWNATAVAPEIYAERASGPDKMRSLLGVNQFDTQNQLPPALREVSGPALERLLDAGTARHALSFKQVEHAIKDLASMALDYAADLEKAGKDVVVVAPGEKTKSTVESLKFSEVKLDRKRMKLRVMPMNAYPTTFAGKVESFGKLRETGDISRQTYLRMLEVPDVAGTTDFLGSDEEIIIRNLHFMVKKGKYLPPLQYDNLDLIVPLTTAYINWYRTRDGADMEVVGMLGQYIEDAIALKEGLGSSDPAAPPAIDPATGMPTNPMDPNAMAAMGQMDPAMMSDPSMMMQGEMPMPPQPPMADPMGAPPPILG